MLIGAALSCFVVSYMAILHEGIYMNFQNCLDTKKICAIVIKNLIRQTVEAEITAMMPLQRVWDAENQMRNKLSNGPRRVQSNVKFIFTEYSATCRHTSVAEGMFVSC